ncbi:MAG: M67 family metallopeptidase, partial [Desulfitobacterium hafniense]|nr:M67 family metallopeptidase [Desulfitobacterium hafniense]
MIIIEKKHYQEILSYSLEALPNEACGLLGGDISHDIKTVKKVYLLTNVDHSPEHFSMDPKEQFNVIRDMRKNNWSLIGNF